MGKQIQEIELNNGQFRQKDRMIKVKNKKSLKELKKKFHYDEFTDKEYYIEPNGTVIDYEP